MSKDIAAFRTAILADLDDAGLATWSNTEIDRAVRRALYAYSEVKPVEVIGTITLAAAGREISLTTLTGLIDVQKVWPNYDSASPRYPPPFAKFELWDDKTTLFIDEATEPQAGETVRVFYTQLHTIEDLDTETATTVPVEDEELIILGACGYAAQIKSRSAITQINPADTSPAQWSQWSNRRLNELRRKLNQLADSIKGDLDARVAVDWEI